MLNIDLARGSDPATAFDLLTALDLWYLAMVRD